MQTQQIINVCAPYWGRAESYGRVARELTLGLQRLGYRVNTLGHSAPNRTLIPVLGGICLGYPTAFHQWGELPMNGKRVAVTMFESDQLPDMWVAPLNACAAVIVPTTWLVPVFRSAGVTVPIHVVPLGVSRAFRFVRRDPLRKPFTFLAIADRAQRKGWHIALNAFLKAFGESPDVRLILKARPGSLGFTALNPNITVIEDEYSDKAMGALYAEADCMVFPCAGEGFGLPPREFAATGGLVMATNWGGTADDIEQWGVPLEYTLVTAWKDEVIHTNLGQWARASEDRLMALMQDAVSASARAQFASERSAAVSQFARQHYSWVGFAQAVHTVWREVLYGERDAA